LFINSSYKPEICTYNSCREQTEIKNKAATKKAVTATNMIVHSNTFKKSE